MLDEGNHVCWFGVIDNLCMNIFVDYMLCLNLLTSKKWRTMFIYDAYFELKSEHVSSFIIVQAICFVLYYFHFIENRKLKMENKNYSLHLNRVFMSHFNLIKWKTLMYKYYTSNEHVIKNHNLFKMMDQDYVSHFYAPPFYSLFSYPKPPK